MNINTLLLHGALAVLATGACAAAGADDVSTKVAAAGDVTDPYVWLEDVHGQKPMEWVRAQNAKEHGYYYESVND